MKATSTYLFGLVLSLTFTVAAFALVAAHVESAHEFISHEVAASVLALLALGQLVAQLLFFLHVGEEEKPRFNFMALCFALLTAAILFCGTLWIMNNLAHGAHDTPQNVFKEENIQPKTYAS